MIDAAAAVAAINEHHGTRYRLAGPMPGGESGATHLIADEAGVQFILKWGNGPEFHVRRTIAIVGRLRAGGYPAPEFVLASSDQETPHYLIQRIMPGIRATVLNRRLLDRIIELNRLQENAATGFAEDWPVSIVETIERGHTEWCVHSSLESYSSETAGMLSELKRTAEEVRRQTFRQHDAVHFDFSTANILLDGDEITGVIDWNGCRAGDRAFDLVTMGFYALEDRATSTWLLNHARSISNPGAVALYLAHVVLRQVDWSIRHHDEAAIARYLAIARIAMEIIRDLTAKERTPF